MSFKLSVQLAYCFVNLTEARFKLRISVLTHFLVVLVHLINLKGESIGDSLKCILNLVNTDLVFKHIH